MSIKKIEKPLDALGLYLIQNQKLINDSIEDLRGIWCRLQEDYLGQGAEETDLHYQILAQQVLIYQKELDCLKKFCSAELDLAKERN